MKVFLVRHGDADAEIPEGLGDEGRALTAKARQQIHAHFQQLSARMGEPALVLTSPLVRAVQTAQILSLALGHEGLLRAHRSLLPDMPVGAMDTLLEESVTSLALVGHAPSMGAMAARLLGMQSAFPKPVPPGTVIGIERGDAGKFLFYAVPGQPVADAL